jgi:ankyrin repeat protein
VTKAFFKNDHFKALVLVVGLLTTGCFMHTSISEAPKSLNNNKNETLCVKGTDCDSTLFDAVKKENSLENVKRFIKAGADVNAKNPHFGETTIMEALPNKEIVIELLSAGAEVDGFDEAKTSNLMWAAHFGDFEITEILLLHGANVNWERIDKRTPLMDAGYGGNPEIVKLMIENGAEVNAVNDYGATALMFASLRGHLEATEILLSKGADPNIKDKDGHTALSSLTKYIERMKVTRESISENELELYNKIINLLKRAETDK